MVTIDLKEKFRQFAKPSKIFKDRDSLRATYIPDNLPHREKEIEDISDILGRPIMSGGTPSNLFLYGKPGGGKTAVTLKVIQDLFEITQEMGVGFNYAFINCQMVDTAYRVYAALCDSIGVKVPFTGLSTDRIFEILIENLDKEEALLTIILDEIDLLMKKDNNKALYSLTRINSLLKKAKVSIIGITNNANFKGTVDGRVRSTLTEQELTFSPYNATQLKDILSERANLGFEEQVVESSALEKASSLAAAEHGDARRALDLLRVAGEVAEKNRDETVASNHVNLASELIESNTVEKVLKTLPIHSKSVLLAITLLETQYQLDQKGRTDPVSTGEVYKKYLRVCKDLYNDGLTQRRVGDLINELDLLGLIRTSVISKGRYGRTRVISLSVQPGEIHKALQEDPRIEEILPPLDLWLNG